MALTMLAALVKLLRRCLNQMTGKSRQYVDTSLKFEKEAFQQVCTAKLVMQDSVRPSYAAV